MASQKVKGLRIELSADTTAVSSALSEVNKSLNGTQKELNQVDKLLKLDPKNVNLLTQKQGLLTSAINDTKIKLEQLNKVKELADKDDSVDKNSKEYRDLATQIEATRIKLQQYENQQEQTNNALKDGGEKVSQFGDMLKAKVVGDVIISGVKGLADAFVAVAKAIADAGKALFDMTLDSASYADELITLSKQYNISTKQLQQYSMASELIDVDVNTIAKSMSKLTKNMTSNSTGVVNAFKQLGIATKDSDGALRDSNEVFNEVIESLGEIENETLQDSLALEIFGKSSAELGPLINGGVEQLAEFNKYLEENNLLLSDAQLNDLGALDDSMRILEATFDGLKNKISAELAPVLTPIIDDLTTFLIEHKDEIIETIKGAIEWLTSDEAKEFYEKLKDTIERVTDTLITKAPKMLENMGKILESLVPISEVLADIAEAIITIASYDGSKVEAISDEYINQMHAQSTVGSGGYGGSGGFGYQSGGFTSNLTINVNTNQLITESQVRGWADIINEQLGLQTN